MTQASLFDFIPSQAQVFMQELRDGAKKRCPCCNRWAQIYPRAITRSMVLQLVIIAREGGWVHYKKFQHLSGDYSKLEHWKLIEHREKNSDDDATRDSGYWRVTERGLSFLRGEIRVPKKLLVFDGEVVGIRDEQTVTVHDCYKENFHYGAMMNEAVA